MITMTLPEACGNALRLYLSPEKGAAFWRIFRSLRKDHKGEQIIYEGTDELVMDVASLQNEVTVFYRIEYVMPGGNVIPGNTSSGTPSATYEDHTTDTLDLLRDRLNFGLAEEVKRGTLFNELGYIQVLTAPPSLQNNLSFPLVTLSLENESPSERSIGDVVDDEYYDEDAGEWGEQVGWIADVNISITGWSLNPTERIALRNAIRRVLIANFSVLAAHGILLPHFTLADSDAVSGEFDAPLYLVNGDFTCIAPVRVVQKSSNAIRQTTAKVIN
ncbi:hypothetical protein Q6670_004058 [Salmonella enterica]|nr:hypothetical protein [Salmonella enterica]